MGGGFFSLKILIGSLSCLGSVSDRGRERNCDCRRKDGISRRRWGSAATWELVNGALRWPSRSR